jgi:hypothetical protein
MPKILGKQVGWAGYGLLGGSSSFRCLMALKLFTLTSSAGLTWRSEPLAEEDSFKAMRAALANGSNFVRHLT